LDDENYVEYSGFLFLFSIYLQFLIKKFIKIFFFKTLFKTLPEISAGLAASVFHFGEVKIPELKQKLRSNGISVML